MNLAFFFEGTGIDGESDITNVTRLYNICVLNEAQMLHLEGGPGTHFGSYLRGLLRGRDWTIIFRDAKRFFEKAVKKLSPLEGPPVIFVFGFSRGALIARHFTAWLDKIGFEVRYLGLWDTVDSTPDLEVSETCPQNVAFARHAIARDEKRRFFNVLQIKANPKNKRQKVEQLVFPGVHSDVGGLYEDNHVIADASLYWIATGAVEAGLLIKDGAALEPVAPDAKIVIHDSSKEATNLWGALDDVPRDLSGIATFMPVGTVSAGFR
jgi:uncharacterized protein (DUF2235 family)